MNQSEFQFQITRIMNTFGKTAFTEERVKLIWSSVKELDDDWFLKTCDHFLATMRQAPLPNDFFESAGKERERLWEIEKANRREESARFSNMLEKESPMLFEIIKKLGNGAMSEADRKSMLEMISNAAKAAEKVNCETCEDTGLVFVNKENQAPSVFKCRCVAGKNEKRNYPTYRGN